MLDEMLRRFGEAEVISILFFFLAFNTPTAKGILPKANLFGLVQSGCKGQSSGPELLKLKLNTSSPETNYEVKFTKIVSRKS